MTNPKQDAAHLSLLACSRCDLRACPCSCHKACRCVPDDLVTARDADTGNPQEWVRPPGFWGWFRAGWRDVECPTHARVTPPTATEESSR